MIRPETDRDGDSVRAVLASAFPSAAEADLVDALRSAGDLVLALVAEEEDAVGFVAFSRLVPEQTEVRAVALAPIGVVPAHQRQGIGSALVRDGLARLAEAGEDLVLVLGETRFYRRFGFTREAASRLDTPYDGPHLLAKALGGQGAGAQGRVRYPPAFAALG
jgi:putative acetyltransferase